MACSITGKGTAMKGWENNAMLYNQQKKAGSCPKCGSKDIKVEEYVRGIRKSISFLCKKCGSSDHFDGFTDK